jgi:hypothetical protein
MVAKMSGEDRSCKRVQLILGRDILHNICSLSLRLQTQWHEEKIDLTFLLKDFQQQSMNIKDNE